MAPSGNPPRVVMAIFGLGLMGSRHLKNMVDNSRIWIKYAVDTDEGQITKAIQGAGASNAKGLLYAEAETVFKDEEIDAVVIASTARTHEEIIMKSLKAGKAVLCEKPLTLDPSSSAACYREAKKQGKPLMCALNRRFDPSTRALKDKIDEGRVGQLQCLKIVHRDQSRPSLDYLKICGGAFKDSMIHDIDLLIWMAGAPPTQVYAQGHAFHPDTQQCQDVDQAFVVLKFANGAIGTIDFSRFASYGYDQRMEAFGSDGVLMSGENPSPSNHDINKSGMDNGQVSKSTYLSRFASSYEMAVDRFCDVVIGDKSEVDIKPQEYLMACHIAELCSQALREGRSIEVGEFPYKI